MTREKSKQIPIGFTPRHREMIDEIMRSKGYPSIASVVQQGIIDLHSSIFKDYVMAKKNKGIDAGDSALIAKTNDTDRFKGLASKLDGEVVEKNGSLYCLYYTYNRKNRYQQEVPLDTLNDTHVAKQYFPSKEDVMKLQKEGKVNYK